MTCRRLICLAGLAAISLAPASLSAGTLLDISGFGPGSGPYTGNNAHSVYGVTFTTSASFSNVSATAQLEGNFHSQMSFATYLYDTTSATLVKSDVVAFQAGLPSPYDLFNGGTFSLTAGDSYAVLISGSGNNAIWDGTQSAPGTLDAAITYNGSIYASAAGANGYTSYGSNNLILNLTAGEATAPEPSSVLLFLAPAVLVVRRRLAR